MQISENLNSAHGITAQVDQQEQNASPLSRSSTNGFQNEAGRTGRTNKKKSSFLRFVKKNPLTAMTALSAVALGTGVGAGFGAGWASGVARGRSYGADENASLNHDLYLANKSLNQTHSELNQAQSDVHVLTNSLNQTQSDIHVLADSLDQLNISLNNTQTDLQEAQNTISDQQENAVGVHVPPQITVQGGTPAQQQAAAHGWQELMAYHGKYMRDDQFSRHANITIVDDYANTMHVSSGIVGMTYPSPNAIERDTPGLLHFVEAHHITLSGALHGESMNHVSTHESAHAATSDTFTKMFNAHRDTLEGITEFLALEVNDWNPGTVSYPDEVGHVRANITADNFNEDTVRKAYFGGDLNANCKIAKAMQPLAYTNPSSGLAGVVNEVYVHCHPPTVPGIATPPLGSAPQWAGNISNSTTTQSTIKS